MYPVFTKNLTYIGKVSDKHLHGLIKEKAVNVEQLDGATLYTLVTDMAITSFGIHLVLLKGTRIEVK